MALTPEEFLKTYVVEIVYHYSTETNKIEYFLAAWRKAEEAAKAAGDPYHGKRTTMVLPERNTGVDRAINKGGFRK